MQFLQIDASNAVAKALQGALIPSEKQNLYSQIVILIFLVTYIVYMHVRTLGY